MSFTVRRTEPDINSKYYITTAGKGYNKCIQGNAKTNAVKNRQSTYSVLPNCVGYAYGRSLEIAQKDSIPELPSCNAEDWNDTCKWEHGQVAKPGAVVCWRSGKNWNSSDGCGHVAVVEEVYSDGSYLISESGWSGFYFRTKKLSSNNYYGNGLTFECFLYNPYVKDAKIVPASNKVDYKSYLQPRGYIKYGDKSDFINRISQFMRKTFPAYTSAAALGPIYGPNLLKSIKEFQRRTNLEVDGFIGPLTLEMLVKFGFKL